MAALKSSALQNDFLCYKQNTFERNLTVGNPQQPCCTHNTSRDQQTYCLYFCLNVGLTKLKACLSSTVAPLVLPVKRIYAERKGTDISSTIRPTASACHIQLNVYFFVSQLNRKWKVREAPLQNKEPVI